jgi:hypothetical protein
MNNAAMKRAIAVAIAGAMMLGAAPPLLAAPLLLNSSAVKAAVANDILDVRYRGHRGHGFGPGAAVAIGALGVIGAIAATGARQGYGPDYESRGYDQNDYDAPAYGPAYGPGYAAPTYRYGRCAGDERFGGTC